MSAPGTEPTEVAVATARVDGVITLNDIADRLPERTGQGTPESLQPQHREALVRVAELAEQLADALARLPADPSSG